MNPIEKTLNRPGDNKTLLRAHIRCKWTTLSLQGKHNKLISLPVFFINSYLSNYVFCTRFVSTTNTITITFKFLKAHL